MPDDVVGSARIRIEPDLSGFDAALEAGVREAADQAAEAIVAAFRSAAQTSAQELSSIGQAGFVDVTQTADLAAIDLQAAFTQAASEADAALGTIGDDADIAGSLSAAADEANLALAGIGDGAGAAITEEFATVGDQIADELSSGAAEADAALEGIGVGAGRAVVSEFDGVGASIEAEMAAGSAGAEKELQSVSSDGVLAAQTISDAFAGSGLKIAGALAAIGVGFGLAGAFSDAEHVNTILQTTEQLIANTGGAAGITAKEIVGLGDALELTTNFESEATQEAANLLLGFKNIRNELGTGNDIFDRTIRDAGDLATALGGDLSGAAQTLGRALEDPIRGVSTLRRANIIFTQEQKDLVRSLVEQGDILGAQTIILDQVEGRIGGVAEASVRASDQIRNSLGNISEEFGAGLLPAAEEFADRLPAIVEDLGPEFRELGEALGDVFGAGIDALLSLSPLIGTTTDLLTIALPVIETFVDLIGLIPDPVLQGAAAFLAFNRGASLLTKVIDRIPVTALESKVASLTTSSSQLGGALTGAGTASGKLTARFPGLTGGLQGVALVAGAGAIVLDQYSSLMQGAADEGKAFADSVRAGFDPATASLDELKQASSDLDTKITDLQGSVDDSFWGRNTVNKDFNESITTSVEELGKFQTEIDAAILAQQQLAAETRFGAAADQFVGLADAMATVRGESDSVADAIANVRQEGDLSDASFLSLATTLGDAALSEEAMADAARLLGTDVESLTGFITNVNTALDGFIDTALGGLPQIAGAFRDSNDDAQVSAREFITGLNEDALELATFFGDIRTITEAGFAEVAGTLAEQGAEIAGVATHELAEAARKGNVELLLRTQEGLNNRNTAIAQGTDYVENVLGPAFVTANGTIAREAVEAFGENFTPAEQVRIAGELAATGLDEQGQRIAAIAATQGATAAQQFGVGLNLEQETIDAAIAAGVAITHIDATVWTEAGVAVGLDFGRGVIDGMRFSFADIDSEAARMANRAEISARAASESQSPSKVFMRIGADMGKGMAIGLDDAGAEVVKAAEDIIQETARNIEKAKIPALGWDPGLPPTMTPEQFAPSLLVRANDAVPDDLIPWQLRFDNLADALLNSRQFPTSTAPVIGDGTTPGMVIEAGAIVVNEARDGVETGTRIYQRLKAEAWLQRRA